MQKLIVCVKRKAGMSFEQFRDHYENVHIPLNDKWIGHLFSGFVRFYPKDLRNLLRGAEQGGPRDVGGCSYDAVSVYSLKNDAGLEELFRIAQNPEFLRLITEDEERFCDRAECRQGFTTAVAGLGLNKPLEESHK